MTPSDGFTGVSETENTIGQRAVEDLTPTINNPTDTKITTVVTENSLTEGGYRRGRPAASSRRPSTD